MLSDRRPELTVDAPGAEEIAVAPWPRLFRERLARRIARSPRERWWVLCSVLAGLFSVGFSITVLSVSLPRIAADLNSTTSTLTWTLTAPLLAFAVVGPTFGKAGDIWGHRRLYLLGLAGAAVFTVLTAVAWDAISLIVFRVLSVAIGAATGPSSMALIMRAFPPGDRVKALGWWQLVMAGSPVIGVVAGGPIVEHVSWRAIFALQVPLMLLALAVAAIVLVETERSRRQPLDLKGAALLGVGITSLLLAMNRGPAWGWGDARVVGAAALFPVLLAVFIRVERRTPHPLIRLEYLMRRNFAFPIANLFFSNFAYMGSFILTPLFLKEAFGYRESRIGNLSIARPLSFSIMSPIAGYLTARIGERTAGVVGSGVLAVSMLCLAALAPGSSDLMIVASLAIAGIGTGISGPAMAASVANSVDEADFGVAGATQQLLANVGAVCGIQLFQTVQEARRAADGMVESYGAGYLVGALTAVLALVCAVFVRRSPRERKTPSRS